MMERENDTGGNRPVVAGVEVDRRGGIIGAETAESVDLVREIAIGIDVDRDRNRTTGEEIDEIFVGLQWNRSTTSPWLGKFTKDESRMFGISDASCS